MRHPRPFVWLGAALTVVVTGLLQAAAPAPQVSGAPQVIAILDGGQTVIGSVEKPAGVQVTGPVSARPPGMPSGAQEPEERDDHVPLPGPLRRMLGNVADDPGRGPSPVAATVIAPGATSDLIVKRDSLLSGGSTSRVAEPSAGSTGTAIFQTYNWYAARSSDNGSTWSYLSPYTTFPRTGAFSGGFCCDQRVTQVTSRNLVIWSLQYIQNGTTNGIRIAVAHGAAGLAANSWQYHDFTPGDFGASYATGYWLDYPSLAVSDNYLYFTYNMFTVASSSYAATVVGRAPLAALDANTSFTLNTYVNTGTGTLTPVSGATSRMFFGAVYGSTTLFVLDWPESTTTPTARFTTGLSSTYFSSYVCTAFDGTNPCGRADDRIQAGWLTSTELGFAWASSQNSAAGRPYPFTRVVILNPASPTTVISQPDLWNASYAYLYPALAVNARGHLGGVIDVLGGSQGTNVASTMLGLMRDDYSGSSWATIAVATSNAGTASAWGDYNAATPHANYLNTWLIGGKVQSGSTANAGGRVHNTWIMRSRDDPSTAALVFTDDPLVAGTTAVKAVHITELRTSIDTVRARNGLAAYTWTDTTLVAGTTTVKAVHVTELRTALSAAYVAAGRAAPTWATATLTAGSTTITAAIITEIRSAVAGIW